MAGASLLLASSAQEDANRIKCADNLRQIGKALRIYSNENKGAYPRTACVMDKADGPVVYTNPKPQLTEEEKAANVNPAFCKAGPAPNDVTAGLFLLLNMQDMSGDVFLCPAVQSAKARGVELPDPARECNFSNPAQLNYSYQNPYPAAGAISRLMMSRVIPAEFAVVADTNPGSDELLTATADANHEAMKIVNSPNHNGDGQNVLYADGHVEFQDNPFAGQDRDNIYTYRKSFESIDSGGIVGSPADETDSVLLPTAKQDVPK